MSYNKVRQFLERFGPFLCQYIEDVDEKMNFYDSIGIEIRTPFNRFFSTFWNIFGGLCTQVFYSW